MNLRRKELDDRFTSGLEFGVGRDGLKYRAGRDRRREAEAPLQRAGARGPGRAHHRAASAAARDHRHRHRHRRARGDPHRQPHLGDARQHVGARACWRRCRARAASSSTAASSTTCPSREVHRPLQARRRDRRERGLAALQARGGDGPGERASGQMVNLLAEQNVARSLDAAAPAGHLPAPRPGRHHRARTSAARSRRPSAGARPRCEVAGAAPHAVAAARRVPACGASSVRRCSRPQPPVIDEVRDRRDALREPGVDPRAACA